MRITHAWIVLLLTISCASPSPNSTADPSGSLKTDPTDTCLPWAANRCKFEDRRCFAVPGTCADLFGGPKQCESGGWEPVPSCPEAEPEPIDDPLCETWAQDYCGTGDGCFKPPDTCASVFGGDHWCKSGRWLPVEGCSAEALRTRFTYPVGDKTTWPAGGWQVWQVLSHHWESLEGNHLAEDLSLSGGKAAVDEPVYSVANGRVIFAKTNGSSYRNVVLIRHEIEGGETVCSFYGHIHNLNVSAGEFVLGGQKIAEILDWADAQTGGSSNNTHLHYVLLNEAYCNFAAQSGTDDLTGSGVCGYDKAESHDLDWTAVNDAPERYAAIDDACGAWQFPHGLIAPSKFINDHR